VRLDCAAFVTEIVWVIEEKPVAEYVIVTVPDAPEIPRLVNVARPEEALKLPVPTTVPVERVAVTTFVAVVTLLPPASRISTTGWVVKADPEVAPLALVVSTSCVAVPTVTVKLADVASVRLADVNVNV